MDYSNRLNSTRNTSNEQGTKIREMDVIITYCRGGTKRDEQREIRKSKREREKSIAKTADSETDKNNRS